MLGQLSTTEYRNSSSFVLVNLQKQDFGVPQSAFLLLFIMARISFLTCRTYCELIRFFYAQPRSRLSLGCPQNFFRYPVTYAAWQTCGHSMQEMTWQDIVSIATRLTCSARQSAVVRFSQILFQLLLKARFALLFFYQPHYLQALLKPQASITNTATTTTTTQSLTWQDMIIIAVDLHTLQ